MVYFRGIISPTDAFICSIRFASGRLTGISGVVV